MSVSTYDPSEVDLFLAILYPVEGYAPDSIISIAKDDSFYYTVKGAAGGVERVHVADKTYTLTLSLSQTSPTNSVLSALATLDDLSGVGMFPLFAKDSSGSSIFISGSCWVEESPEATYTGSIEARTWKIRCSEMVFGIAGNEADRSIISQVGQLGSMLGQFGGNF